MAGCLMAAAGWLPAAGIQCNEKQATFLGGSSSQLQQMYCRCSCSDCMEHTCPGSLQPGRIWNLLAFYRHSIATDEDSPTTSDDANATQPPSDEETEQCWQKLSFHAMQEDKKVELKEHAVSIAQREGGHTLVGKKLFVYHFPPGVESQPLLRGGWMRGAIKCYLEETGEYMVSYDNRTHGMVLLGLNFTHFSTRPPLPGSHPQLLPTEEPTAVKRKRTESETGSKRKSSSPRPARETTRAKHHINPGVHGSDDETTVSDHTPGEDGDAEASSGARHRSSKGTSSRNSTGSDEPAPGDYMYGLNAGMLGYYPWGIAGASSHAYTVIPGLGGVLSPAIGLGALLGGAGGLVSPVSGYQLGLLSAAQLMGAPTLWYGAVQEDPTQTQGSKKQAL